MGRKDKSTLVTLGNAPMETEDETFTKYLSKLGKVVSTYRNQKYKSGPLKEVENSNKTVKLELKADVQIQSCHMIDGKKFEIHYKGMPKTCWWCLKTRGACKAPVKIQGKSCKAAKNPKRNFDRYIKKLWSSIQSDQEEVTPSISEDDSHANEDIEFQLPNVHPLIETENQIEDKNSAVNNQEMSPRQQVESDKVILLPMTSLIVEKYQESGPDVLDLSNEK